MYLVVEFLSTKDIGLIPEVWLTGNGKQCYWPKTKNINMLNRAVKTSQPPNQESWDCFDIRVLYENASYDKARKKLPLAEETSDLYTDADDEISETRKKRPNRKYLSSSEDDDDERELPCKSARTENTVNSRSSSGTKNLQVRSPTPPTLPPLFQSVSPPRPPRPSTPATPAQTQDVRRSPRRMCTPESGKTTTPIRPPLPPQLSHRAPTPGASTAEVLQLIKAVEENTATTKQNNHLLQQLLRVVTAQSAQPSKDQRKLKLPLSSLQDLDEANTALADAMAFKSVVMQLGLIGGSDLKHTVYNILEAAFATPLARQINWIGSGTKRAFKTMKIKEAVTEATRKSPTTEKSSNNDIESFMKLWFRNAVDRDGGRKEREARKAASTVTGSSDN